MILSVFHLAGSDNGIADTFSHNQFTTYRPVPICLMHVQPHCSTSSSITSQIWSCYLGSEYSVPYSIHPLNSLLHFYQLVIPQLLFIAWNPFIPNILCTFAGFLGWQHFKHQVLKCYLSDSRSCNHTKSPSHTTCTKTPLWSRSYQIQGSKGKPSILPATPSNTGCAELHRSASNFWPIFCW